MSLPHEAINIYQINIFPLSLATLYLLPYKIGIKIINENKYIIPVKVIAISLKEYFIFEIIIYKNSIVKIVGIAIMARLIIICLGIICINEINIANAYPNHEIGLAPFFIQPKSSCIAIIKRIDINTSIIYLFAKVNRHIIIGNPITVVNTLFINFILPPWCLNYFAPNFLLRF